MSEASPSWSSIAVFYGVALAGISLAALALTGLGDGAGQGVHTLVTAAAMFAPLLGVVVAQKLRGRGVFQDLDARPRFNRWLAVASGLALSITALSLLIGGLLPGTAWDWEMNALFERFGPLMSEADLVEARAQIDALPVHPILLAFPQAVIAGATINALFAFGEEIGWRGFMQRELGVLGFWRSSLLTGALWGLWHAPLILTGHNYPTQRVAGIALFTLICVLLSPLHSWVRLRSGTVWAAAVLHGTFNASAGAAMMVVAGPELVVGVQGVAGAIALLVLNVALFGAHRTGRIDLE